MGGPVAPGQRSLKAPAGALLHFLLRWKRGVREDMKGDGRWGRGNSWLTGSERKFRMTERKIN